MDDPKTADAPTASHHHKLESYDVESHVIPVSLEAAKRFCRNFRQKTSATRVPPLRSVVHGPGEYRQCKDSGNCKRPAPQQQSVDLSSE